MKQGYIPLHLKYRPQNFNTIIGHTQVTNYIEIVIQKNKIGFAYLIAGQHGSGKTTLARIMAKAINCTSYSNKIPCNCCSNCLNIHLGHSLDFYEIDGARNTGIDNIREMIENLHFAPIVGRYKICLIDEVHMLSNSAFNSLLKTLESPPMNTIFILLTTAVNKIPDTIISRCQKILLSPIPDIDLSIAISKIAKNEQLRITNKGLINLLQLAKGSFRDALNVVETFILNDEPITSISLHTKYLVPECRIIKNLVKKIFILNFSEALIIIKYLQNHTVDIEETINILYSLLIHEYINYRKLDFLNKQSIINIKTLNKLLKYLADYRSNRNKNFWNYFISLVIFDNRRIVKASKTNNREKKVLYISKYRICSN